MFLTLDKNLLFLLAKLKINYSTMVPILYKTFYKIFHTWIKEYNRDNAYRLEGVESKVIIIFSLNLRPTENWNHRRGRTLSSTLSTIAKCDILMYKFR